MQNTPAGDVRPLQRWRVLVKANTEGLNPGNHASDISIRAVGAKDIATLLPVSANVVSPVRAIPAQFFFGLVKPNASVTRRIKFYFSGNCLPSF
jgi:hypothetical protein